MSSRSVASCVACLYGVVTPLRPRYSFYAWSSDATCGACWRKSSIVALCVLTFRRQIALQQSALRSSMSFASPPGALASPWQQGQLKPIAVTVGGPSREPLPPPPPPTPAQPARQSPSRPKRRWNPFDGGSAAGASAQGAGLGIPPGRAQGGTPQSPLTSTTPGSAYRRGSLLRDTDLRTVLAISAEHRSEGLRQPRHSYFTGQPPPTRNGLPPRRLHVST